MKTVDTSVKNDCQRNETEPEEVTDLLIDSKRGQNPVECSKYIDQMGHKGHLYQRVLLKNNVTQDSRSQSLPNQIADDLEVTEKNPQKKVANVPESPQSPTSEAWFKTWPERCEKVKLDSNSDSTNTQKLNKCDNVTNGKIKIQNKVVSLNEALQNISLAYSPVTKQLHLVEQPIHKEKDLLDCNKISDVIEQKKGHKRTEAGSFSSTISSISDPSPSGSLLDDDQRSMTSFEECAAKQRKKSLTNFFSRNVFSWKNGPSSSVWKLFGKNAKENLGSSPNHVVASSTALIQHPRPSNLPAKTEEEEQRHREEYKAILAAAKKKEAQNTATRQKLQKMQLQQEEHHASTTKHFTQNVLPNWETMRCNKKTKDLWWQGLPSSVRGKVWRLAIGNELNVTSQLYEICLSRAQIRLNNPEPSNCEQVGQESSMDVIQLDISRTFPNLCIFQEGGPYSDVLHSLLAAYVCYRPDVGYVQGMSYIAAILILNMEQFDAFICFANLLNQPLHLSAFTLNQSQMQAYYNAYNEVFSYNLPRLFGHFESSGLTPDLYLLDWIYTIFAKAMPLDVACRVWDIFLRDGYEFIFRTALGILHLNQDSLMMMDFLHGAQFLTHLPDDMSSDQLFKSIQAVTTNIGKLNFCQIVEKCSSNVSVDDGFS